MLDPMNGGGYRTEVTVNHWRSNEEYLQANNDQRAAAPERTNSTALNKFRSFIHFFQRIGSILSGRESSGMISEGTDGSITESIFTTTKSWNVRIQELNKFLSMNLNIRAQDNGFIDENMENAAPFEVPRDGRYPGGLMRA